MTGTQTFTIIKPNAVEQGNMGAILQKITDTGFKVVALKYHQLTTREAKTFYAIHKERPFFEEMIEFITRSPVAIAILEKENAVEDFRTLVGATDPKDAAEGTIRSMYASSITENAIHGSDSDQNAKIECSYFFPEREVYRNKA